MAVQVKSAGADGSQKESKPTIGDAWKVMLADKRILLLGAVQSLFEGRYLYFMIESIPLI